MDTIIYDIDIKKGESGQWHGVIVAPNTEPVYSQEAVHNKQDAIDTAKTIRDKGGLHCRIWVHENGGKTLIQ